MRRTQGRLLGSTLGAFLLVAAACGTATGTTGSTPEPTATTSTTAPSTTVPSTSTTAPPATTTTTAPPTGTTPTEGPTEPVLGPPPFGVLVAGADGAVAAQPDGSQERFVVDPVRMAVDDTWLGLVVQVAGSRWEGSPLDTIIWWLPIYGSEPQQLLVPTGDQWLRLHGVVRIEDVPHVVYTRDEGTQGPEDFRETLRLMNLETRQVVEVATVGGWESGTGPIGLAPWTFGFEWFAEGLSGFAFLDLNGDPVTHPLDPYGGSFCGEGVLAEPEECAMLPAQSGDSLAFLRPREDAGFFTDFELVVASPDGERIYPLHRPDQGWWPTSLAIHEGVAVVNRRVSGQFDSGPASPLFVDLATGSITTIGQVGHAEPIRTFPSTHTNVRIPTQA